MNAIKHIKATLNKQEFLAYLITLTLALLFIGYAPSSIALGVFVFFSIRYSLINKKFDKPSITLLLPLALYALFILTLLWTIDLGLTKKGLSRLISLFIIPFTFLITPKFSLKNQQLILKQFTVINVIYGSFFLIVAFFNFLKSKDLSVFTYHELVCVLDLNAIYVSVFFAVSLFYLISKSKKTNLDKVLILFFINLIILLASKMLLIILAISSLIYLFFFKGFKYIKTPKTIIFILIVCSVIGFSSKGIVNRFLEEKTTNIEEVLYKEKFNKVYLWTGTSLRLFQNRILYEQLKEESIFWKGFGLFASRVDLKKRHLEYNTYQGFHTYNYHNQYSQVFAETGVFGLILILLMLIATLIRSIQTKDFLFIMFGILMVMLFLAESFLWVQRGVIFFTLFYCLFNRTDYNKPKT